MSLYELLRVALRLDFASCRGYEYRKRIFEIFEYHIDTPLIDIFEYYQQAKCPPQPPVRGKSKLTIFNIGGTAHTSTKGLRQNPPGKGRQKKLEFFKFLSPMKTLAFFSDESAACQ